MKNTIRNTTIELAVVILILAIMAACASPFLMNQVNTQREMYDYEKSLAEDCLEISFPSDKFEEISGVCCFDGGACYYGLKTEASASPEFIEWFSKNRP